MKSERIVVCGAGDFVGGLLVAGFPRQGHRSLLAVDVKPFDEWRQLCPEAENVRLGLPGKEAYQRPLSDVPIVYNLTPHKSVSPEVSAMMEYDACPALPDEGGGWEKPFSERICHHSHEDFGLASDIARYPSVDTWSGGCDNVPGAVCHKVIEAELSGQDETEIWGEGHQTRSFMHSDHSLKGTQAILDSDSLESINLGKDELVCSNQFVGIVEGTTGIRPTRYHKSIAPRSFNSRNSDNTLINNSLGWAQSIRLHQGIENTHHSIPTQIIRTGGDVRPLPA